MPLNKIICIEAFIINYIYLAILINNTILLLQFKPLKSLTIKHDSKL